jgi:energy-coupling factor transporter ATP-binding protein EcfA2
MARGPMRIRSAKIKNFRGVDELELELPAADDPAEGGVLVLGGDNGFGKTTVLEALLLGLGRADLLPPDSAPLGEQVRFGCQDFSIALDVELDGRTMSLACNRATLEKQQIEIADRRSGGVVSIPNGTFWRSLEWLAPKVVYVSARRDPDVLGEPAAEARGARSSRESRRIAELKRTLVNIFNRQRNAKTQSAERAGRFEQLQRFVRRFLGDDATVDVMYVDDSDRNGQDVVLRRGELPDDVDTLAAARARAQERGDVPVVLPIDRLSSGQLALFAFVEPLLFSTEPPDVVLIDEPERHLHVQWQRVLLPALQELRPTTQFVVATHSHEIMQSVTSDEVHYLLPRDDPRRRRLGAVSAESAP